MNRWVLYTMLVGGCALIGQAVAGPRGMTIGVGIAMVLAALALAAAAVAERAGRDGGGA